MKWICVRYSSHQIDKLRTEMAEFLLPVHSFSHALKTLMGKTIMNAVSAI